MGDHGETVFTDGSLTSVQTTDPTEGGADTITAGPGANVIFGGADSDNITAGGDASPDTIVGDEGQALFYDNGKLKKIQTQSPQYGADDFITAGDGPNVILGGSGADKIDGGNGTEPDIVLGDNGVADFWDTGTLSKVSTSDPGFGGNDQITTHHGPDHNWRR